MKKEDLVQGTADNDALRSGQASQEDVYRHLTEMIGLDSMAVLWKLRRGYSDEALIEMAKYLLPPNCIISRPPKRILETSGKPGSVIMIRTD